MVDVPRISLEENKAKSDAFLSPNIPDTCAAWTEEQKKKARKLLRASRIVYCLDATAYVALNAMALDMLYSGKQVKAKLEKAW